ncbi:MAG: sigma-70 family RNA polymerase sigma factor [Xanthomonadales bacterium]|nr:hypothetical protein [Xanthomonadales bacterium]MCC6592122.1 sigma-70 family RNA polymerase sigma factor [Xanthomonadales bacterium]MCE7932529.1 sigma-70 family RNA polymerase sigma factor [Xanthomonadales bacterium PRO6]
MADADTESPMQGSGASFDALMRCVPGLRALLLRMTRDVEATNDLAQEVTFAAWQAIQAGRLRDAAALPAYALQCARNAALAHARKPRPATFDELPEAESAWAERQPTPLECCEEGEIRALARQVLAELPTERDRALIRGFYVDGRGKPELMAEFELGKDQFDRVISRARGRMRELMLEKLNAGKRAVGGSAAAPLPFRSNTGASR